MIKMKKLKILDWLKMLAKDMQMQKKKKISKR